MSDALTGHAPTEDAFWMRRALGLARRGQGRVEPNPMVGCVLVHDGSEVSHGWHDRYGGPHAEVNALSGLSDDRVRLCDLYVTLEPCSHHGKTPPCLDLLLAKRPRRVVVAMHDPFPQVAGRGIAGLRSAGIDVAVGVLESEARLLNAPYLKRIATGLPWVIAKWAMTLDGAIATSGGDSKWITGEAARGRVHGLRSRMDAIMVGSETVLRDDPLLTARLPQRPDYVRSCTRVVLDRRLRIPTDSQLVRTAHSSPLCIATTQQALELDRSKAEHLRQAGATILILPTDEKTDPLGWLLRHRCQQGATNVLVEGGGQLLGAFFDGGWVDQVECFIAPRILGSSHARRPVAGVDRPWMNQTMQLERVTLERDGEDIHISGFVQRTAASPPPNAGR
jgi:diaminohydroxyphosphoribosylaminopyrimidine deaminase/5-amino-6-(5-phosphoribosylamino)uracil reductase